MELILLSGALIALGVYNWILLNKIKAYEEQLATYNELFMSMAMELEELGSPNVKVFKKNE